MVIDHNIDIGNDLSYLNQYSTCKCLAPFSGDEQGSSNLTIALPASPTFLSPGMDSAVSSARDANYEDVIARDFKGLHKFN